MKTTTTHTPAPWKWQGTKGNPGLFAYLSGPNHTQVIAAPDGVSIGAKDAALIAAAPDLLDALSDAALVLDSINRQIGGSSIAVREVLDKARATIAKAEGRT